MTCVRCEGVCDGVCEGVCVRVCFRCVGVCVHEDVCVRVRVCV